MTQNVISLQVSCQYISAIKMEVIQEKYYEWAKFYEWALTVSGN